MIFLVETFLHCAGVFPLGGVVMNSAITELVLGCVDRGVEATGISFKVD